MKLTRRTAILGLLTSFLVRAQAQPNPGSTLTLEIPEFSTIEFISGDRKVSFTSAEVMSALGAVEVPPTIPAQEKEEHYTPDGCEWSDYEARNVCPESRY
jgi:hypothetical protein